LEYDEKMLEYIVEIIMRHIGFWVYFAFCFTFFQDLFCHYSKIHINGFIIIIQMNILTIFSGRRDNIEVLVKYLKTALEYNIIDEVHFWNNTRNVNDENYIKSISNLKRTSSFGDGNYIRITPMITNNSFECNIRAPNDIHIKITNDNIEYEIVLGGWKNTKSVIRENNCEITSVIADNIADGYTENTFTITCENGTLHIIKNMQVIMSQKIHPHFTIQNIYFKTGFGSVGDLTYATTQNKGFYFMDTCEKSWKNYYNHYTDAKYENDIILKCDDDIVFIDLHKLPSFIEFTKTTNYDLVFANTINNGVASYYQQNRYNLIPKNVMDLEYPDNGLKGSLWENGKMAEKIHEYFIDNYESFLHHDYNKEIIPISTRFSINFFGYKGNNWHKIKDCFQGDDEYNLTVDYVINRQFKNVLYSDFYVSHLSFCRQNETGIDLCKLIKKYHTLYSQYSFPTT